MAAFCSLDGSDVQARHVSQLLLGQVAANTQLLENHRNTPALVNHECSANPVVSVTKFARQLLDISQIDPAALRRNLIHGLIYHQRQPDFRNAAQTIIAVAQVQRAIVGFGNLPAQHQANARAAGLGGIKRHKDVGAVT